MSHCPARRPGIRASNSWFSIVSSTSRSVASRFEQLDVVAGRFAVLVEVHLRFELQGHPDAQLAALADLVEHGAGDGSAEVTVGSAAPAGRECAAATGSEAPSQPAATAATSPSPAAVRRLFVFLTVYSFIGLLGCLGSGAGSATADAADAPHDVVDGGVASAAEQTAGARAGTQAPLDEAHDEVDHEDDGDVEDRRCRSTPRTARTCR